MLSLQAASRVRPESKAIFANWAAVAASPSASPIQMAQIKEWGGRGVGNTLRYLHGRERMGDECGQPSSLPCNIDQLPGLQVEVNRPDWWGWLWGLTTWVQALAPPIPSCAISQ